MVKSLPTTFVLAIAAAVLGVVAPLPSYGQDASVADPNEVRMRWSQMSTAEFAESVISSRPVRSEWDEEKDKDYDQAVYAEAARRMMAPDVDFAEVAQYGEDMLRWSGKAWDEEGRRAFLVHALLERDAASKLSAKHVNGLMPDAKRLLAPEQFEQLRQSLTALPDDLRHGWGEMSAADFVDSVVSSRPIRQAWPEERNGGYRQAVHAEAGRRLMETDEDFADVAKHVGSLVHWSFQGWGDDEKRAFLTEYLINRDGAAKLAAKHVDDLVVHAKELLTPEQFEQVRKKVSSVSKSAKETSYKELWDHLGRTFHLTDRTYEDLQERRKWVADWIRSHDLSERKVSSLKRLLSQAISPATHGMVEMEAEWTAQLIPPRSGEYQFDVTPLTVSSKHGEELFEQSARVEINGQQVVVAAPENWQQTRANIQLTAGQPVSLKVRLTNSARGGGIRVAVGQLYWQGPGVAKQLVPPSAFRQPESSEPGVKAEVIWKGKDDVVHMDQAVLANIDQVFRDSTINTFGKPFDDLVNELFERYMADEYFTLPEDEEEAKAYVHPVAQGGASTRVLLVQLTSAQRKQLATRLVQSPEVYKKASFKNVLRLHNYLQPGAEREAVDVLGVWMSEKANLATIPKETSERFYTRNFLEPRYANIPLLWHHADSFAWLEQDYLEAEDGTCSLPAAYVVGYGYLMQGKILDWIELLDAKLADESITGDIRVNWLIARCMAEEIRRNPADRYYHAVPDFSAGIDWLNEASLVAQSPQKKKRVAFERMHRFIVLGKWAEAEAIAQEYAEVDSKGVRRIASLRELRDKQTHKARQQVRKAYLAELERRRQRAEESGNAATQTRLEQLIERAKADLEAMTNASPSE